ncbi:DNA/RNA nuclease SfsA [Furfurilactobacillus curtus]|uniref:Sugar fermentation stimulation protein n=1 Tax=Furfurilactobacillus curtus TaxID=1746200 RepID=A0ABQ5JP86_9LACO
MLYQDSQLATYIDRPTRFTCRVRLYGVMLETHLKNTGRGADVLLAGAIVVIVPAINSTRKTHWDLVAVRKQTERGNFWVNVDSSAPNQVTKEAVASGLLKFPGLTGTITEFRPEVTFGDSRVDFKGSTSTGEEFFVETKGCTLENQGVVAFPDAPTVRAVKHVYNLDKAMAAGYRAYLMFVIQIDNIDLLTLNQAMAPKLTQAIRDALPQGLQIMAYCSAVDEFGIALHRPTHFEIDAPFVDPQAAG